MRLRCCHDHRGHHRDDQGRHQIRGDRDHPRRHPVGWDHQDHPDACPWERPDDRGHPGHRGVPDAHQREHPDVDLREHRDVDRVGPCRCRRPRTDCCPDAGHRDGAQDAGAHQDCW